MKARIKATGEIVEVYSCGERYLECSNMNKSWWEEDLDFDVEKKFAENCFNGIKQDVDYNPDYWTRLEHTYAGMAMQGMVKTYEQMMRADIECKMDCCEHVDAEVANGVLRSHADACAEFCVEFAHALVEKYKKEERK